MHQSDPHAANIFGRLFSYTRRSELREPIEDFCTEALVWCMVTSKPFAENFLQQLRLAVGKTGNVGANLKRFSGEIEIGTQLVFNADPNEENSDEDSEPTSGRFDIVIRPQIGRDFIIVIESKVRFDAKIASQIEAYDLALNANLHFRPYSERYVVALTPWVANIPPKYARLTWPAVHGLLEDTTSTETPVLKQFASFLQARNLSRLRLMKLQPQQLKQIHNTSPFFRDAKNLLGRFKNEAGLRSIFKKGLERPVLDYDEDDQTTWFGIYTGNRNPWAYAGFWLREDDAFLCVQFMIDGDFREWSKRFPSGLRKAVKEASQIAHKPETEDGRTAFYFMRRLDAALADTPEEIFLWFKETLEAGEKFLTAQLNS